MVKVHDGVIQNACINEQIMETKVIVPWLIEYDNSTEGQHEQSICNSCSIAGYHDI